MDLRCLRQSHPLRGAGHSTSMGKNIRPISRAFRQGIRTAGSGRMGEVAVVRLKTVELTWSRPVAGVGLAVRARQAKSRCCLLVCLSKLS
jgi:hypothetical protein